MRQIKFRAFVKKDKAMVSDVRIGNSLNECFKSDGVVFMQFTGLLDVNGVEIYEGDILKDNSISKDRYEFGEFVYGVIEFVKSGFCEVYRHSDGRVYHEDIDGVHYVVVGNIYQNPELLK
jgi:uncharacterized phage protein (TIGR01671 family)